MTVNAKQRGFTLTEMVIVIIILTVLVAISTPVLVQQFQIFSSGQRLLNADWQGRVGLGRMVRDIRDTDNVTTAKSDEISFYDTQNNTINYKVVSNQLIQTISGSQSALADNIGSLVLHYYDEDDNEITTPITGIDLDRIKYLTITLNIVDNNVNINLTTAVFLWNMAT